MIRSSLREAAGDGIVAQVLDGGAQQCTKYCVFGENAGDGTMV